MALRSPRGMIRSPPWAVSTAMVHWTHGSDRVAGQGALMRTLLNCRVENTVCAPAQAQTLVPKYSSTSLFIVA